MSKTKLLILSLISLIFLSCSSQKNLKLKNNLSISYISGDLDGLILRNLLESHLSSASMYDPLSNFTIEAGVDTVAVYLSPILIIHLTEKMSQQE